VPSSRLHGALGACGAGFSLHGASGARGADALPPLRAMHKPQKRQPRGKTVKIANWIAYCQIHGVSVAPGRVGVVVAKSVKVRSQPPA